MILHKLGLWPARAVWVLVPLVIGTALAEALTDRPSTPRVIVEVLLWTAWFAILVALLAPSPQSLTLTRVAAPTTLGVTVVAGFGGGWTSTTVLALGFSALFCAVVFLPTFGDKMINGSAYGSERRMALRPPAVALVGPAQLSWLLIFAGIVGPAVLLLREQYIVAAITAILGGAGIWAAGRILHQLSKRWIVFVPAGFVIHDPMMIIDSVLFRRNQVSALGPALVPEQRAEVDGSAPDETDGPDRADGADETRADLSGGALGLAVEVALREPTLMGKRERGHVANIEVTNVIFSPTLPGAMLSEARIRGVKIGPPSGP